MKTKLASAILAVGALGMASGANAYVFKFDPDGSAGGGYTPTAIDTLNFKAQPTTYSILQDLGADGILNDGDTFSESFAMDFSFGSLAGTPVQSYDANAGGAGGTAALPPTEVYMDVVLTGTVSNVSITGGTGSQGDLVSGASLASFDVSFAPTPGSILKMYYDPDEDHTDGDSVEIATLAIGGGGASAFQLQNSSPTNQFGVDAAFVSMPEAGVFTDMAGNELSALIPLVFAVADASVNIQSISATSGTTGNDAVFLNVQDNGGTAQLSIPEPGVLALMGLGLVGLGFARKRAA